MGERRIGVAISDATRTLARPVGVLRCRRARRRGVGAGRAGSVAAGWRRGWRGDDRRRTAAAPRWHAERHDTARGAVRPRARHPDAPPRRPAGRAADAAARPKAGWPCGRRTGASGSSGSTPPRPPSFFRTISTRAPGVRSRWRRPRSSSGWTSHANAHGRARLHLLLRHRHRRRRAGGDDPVDPHRRARSRAIRRPRRSSRFRRAPVRPRSGGGSSTRASCADDYTFRAALWWSGEARNLQAGEYRFDRADESRWRSSRRSAAVTSIRGASRFPRG